MSSIIVDIFEKRCRTLLKSHKERAKRDGQQLDYGLEEIRSLVRENKQCHYCGVPLDYTFHIDHARPSSRDPNAHRLANLVCCCARCDECKGILTGVEFLNLLDLLDSFHPAASSDVLARLRAGGKGRYGRKKKGG